MISFLIGDIVWIDAGRLSVYVYCVADLGDDDGESFPKVSIENWFNNVGRTCCWHVNF